MSFICQRYTQDLQDFAGTSIQLHIMQHNHYQAVSADGGIDLYSYSILGSSSKLFDFEVLLQPFEEKFHLP